MINLAKKEREITIPLEDEQFPDLGIRMQTLTDVEAAELSAARMSANPEQLQSDSGEVTFVMPYKVMMSLFSKKVRGFNQEMQIGGEPFDPKNEDHVYSLKLAWKMKAMAELVTYSSGLTEETVKNSLTLAVDLPPDTPSPETSVGVNVDL